MIDEMSKWKSNNSLGYEVVIGCRSNINGVSYYSVVFDDFSSDILEESEIRAQYTPIGSLKCPI